VNGAGGRPALRSAAWIAAILSVFVLVRLPLVTAPGSVRGWNGDSAIFGLMAKKIHDGRGFDVFFWGQNYMGPLTPALAAGIRTAFLDPAGAGETGGPISLRLAAMAEIAFGIALTVLGLTALFGRAIAVAAGMWMALGPPFFIRLSALHKSGLGPEMSFALGSVLFYLAADALTRPRPLLDRAGGRFALGLLGGVGWWMNQTIVFVLLPVACLALARSRPRLARAAGPALAGAALGYLPVWMGRLLGWYEPAGGPVMPPWQLREAPARLVHLVGTDFWRFTGLEGFAPAWALVAGGVVLLALLVVGAARSPARLSDTDGPSPAGLALVAAIAGLGAAVLVLREVDTTQLRYATPALPATLALVLLAVGEAARRARRRIPSVLVAVALGGLAAVTALFLARQARDVVAGILREPDPRGPLEAITAQGYSVCHAGYDTAYTLQFLSDERVRFIPYHSFDRNRALSARLRAEPGPQCFVTDEGTVRPWLPSDAAQEGGPARRRAPRP
jgi:hypothetical protein